MRAIHQLVAGYSGGDAISNEARRLRALFRAWGASSEIFCESRRILPELRSDSRDISELSAAVDPADIVLLHLSIGSDVNDRFAELKARKCIRYHNITPPHFFRGIQEQVANHLERGLAQVKQLAGTAEVNMAVSRFNADELIAAGYRDVTVHPLMLDFSTVQTRPARGVMRKYSDGLKNILFVGRCAPNKRIEDCLAAFYFYQKYVQPNARFIHAGSYAGMEQYQALLYTYARDLQLENVEFTGSLRQDELNACYQIADAFLCMSEHEGFCIPVMESMATDVPVLAYAAGAVPDTMRGAGVLLREKRFDLAAEILGTLTTDGEARQAVIAAQQKRIDTYRQRDLGAELKALLEPLLD